ncbi:MAG: beta-ketoacyl-ACP synthase II [Candidatus Hydrogenedentes bacterium]|nr:beta-ketoacyl-ACP synthase II [Candidatus Hydrogenedentota bacterium]
MSTKVVITGMGVVSPVGNDVKTFWASLCSGKSGARAISHFDTTEHGTKFAAMAEDVEPHGMNKKDVRRNSRYALFALEASDQAMEQSGIDLGKENPFRCGVIVGSGIGGLEEINGDSVRMAEGGPRRVSPLMIPKGLSNMASGVVAIRHGFQGPNKAIVTACATATQCIGDAADHIRLGKADVMIAGGAEATIIPFGIAGFNAMHALSTRNDAPEKASRPFDKDRDGFVMGEGAGMLVLESEAHARARGAEILGEVLSMGETCDANHITAPLPDGSGVAQAMKNALDQAGLRPDQVDYYNAHGTSTALNDAGETKALKLVFGEKMPLVSSTKSMIGHLLGAAGAVEALACLLAIRDNVCPPNINYDTPDPDCDVNIIANEAREARVKIVMSNSLGFGGHNASILLGAYAG